MHWIFQKLWNYTIPFSSLLNFLCWHQLNGTFSFTVFELTVLTWAIPSRPILNNGVLNKILFLFFFLKHNCHGFIWIYLRFHLKGSTAIIKTKRKKTEKKVVAVGKTAIYYHNLHILTFPKNNLVNTRKYVNRFSLARLNQKNFLKPSYSLQVNKSVAQKTSYLE